MFGSTFFRNVSVVVLLTATNVLSAATPAVNTTAPANTTSSDVGSDDVPQFAEGNYIIGFGVNNILRSVLGNAHDVVTALPLNIIPSPVWDIRRGKDNFFTLSVGGKNAGNVKGGSTIPLGKEIGLWVISKPSDRHVGPNDWIILRPPQTFPIPEPEAGWKLADGKITGPLTIENQATVFTFLRVNN